MARMFKDPLLDSARVILMFIMGLLAIGGTATLIGIPVVLVKRADLAEALIERGSDIGVGEAQIAVITLLLLGTVLLATIFYAALQLKRIIDTVGQGDPFVPANADRLRLMAWLTLGAQIVLFPLAIFAFKLAEAFKQTEQLRGDFSLEGIFLVLILFILARIFRKGTEMRSDLEGTV